MATIRDQNPVKVMFFALCIPDSTFTQKVQSLIVKGSTVPVGSEPSVCRLRRATETLKAKARGIKETETIEKKLDFSNIADTCVRSRSEFDTTGPAMLYIETRIA